MSKEYKPWTADVDTSNVCGAQATIRNLRTGEAFQVTCDLEMPHRMHRDRVKAVDFMVIVNPAESWTV